MVQAIGGMHQLAWPALLPSAWRAQPVHHRTAPIQPPQPIHHRPCSPAAPSLHFGLFLNGKGRVLRRLATGVGIGHWQRLPHLGQSQWVFDLAGCPDVDLEPDCG